MKKNTYRILSTYFNADEIDRITTYLKTNEKYFSQLFSVYKIYAESGFFMLKREETHLPCEILVTRTGFIYVQLQERVGSGRYKRCDLALELKKEQICVVGLERVHEEAGPQEFARMKEVVRDTHHAGCPKPGVINVRDLYYLHDAKPLQGEDGHIHPFDKIVMITEFINGGTLTDRMSKSLLNDGEKALVSRKVCQGILSFKQANLSHNDLHAGNVLLQVGENDKIEEVVICDFGKVTKIGEPTPHIINLRLIPPDFVRTEKYIANKFDEFTLGLLLYSIYLGVDNPWMNVVFAAANETHAENRTLWEEIGKNPRNYLGLESLKKAPAPIAHLITQLLEPDPEKRLAVEAALAFFESLQ